MSLILVFIDVASFIELCKNALHLLCVLAVCRADKDVIGDVERSPNLLNIRNNLIAKSLWVLPRGFSLALDFLPVLIGTRKKTNVFAQHALIAGNGIRNNGSISMTNVNVGVSVVDGCCDVILVVHQCYLLAPQLCGQILSLLYSDKLG